MAKEIAVFLGPDGACAKLGEPGHVVIFRRAQGSWQVDREEDVSLGEVKGMGELRAKIAGMLRLMDGCRIFVARSASGVPYFELEKAGCSVWEYHGKPASFLEHIWDLEEKDRTPAKPPASPAVPVPEERSPGHFYISLAEMQRNDAEVSSKQVLRKFIRGGRFDTLEISCSHTPWP